MLIGGNTNPNAGALGSYLLRQGKNEKVALWEIRGTMAEDVKSALYEMEAIASGTKCENFLYHAHIDPRRNENLTQEQFIHAADVLEKNLGLEGHQRVIVEHVKDGRQHVHIVWNRIDVDTMTAARLSHNYRAHELTKFQLEQEFGLEHVEGVHIGRDGKRPPRAPRGGEIERGKRSGIDPRAIREDVTELWQAADSGKAFVAALEAHGYLLAQGDKRDFVLVDQAGDAHNLRRRIEGVKLAELRERLSGVNLSLTVEQAQTIQAERMHDRSAFDEARALDALHDAAIQKTLEEIEADKKVKELRDEARHAAIMGATIYDKAGMVPMQQDAMRHLDDAYKIRKKYEKERNSHATEANPAPAVASAPEIQAIRGHPRPQGHYDALNAQHAEIKEQQEHNSHKTEANPASGMAPDPERQTRRAFRQSGHYDALKSQQEQITAQERERAKHEQPLSAAEASKPKAIEAELTPEQKRDAEKAAIRERQKRIMADMQEASRQHIKEREQQGRSPTRDRERERER